jgi:hypothetical protein
MKLHDTAHLLTLGALAGVVATVAATGLAYAVIRFVERGIEEAAGVEE